jgi:hypothetical protein
MFSATYIENIYKEGNFRLVFDGRAAEIYVSDSDYAGVIRAANDLRDDVKRVTGIVPELHNHISSLTGNTVFIGTMGKNAVIDGLIAEGRLDAADLSGKWESFIIQVVANPIPGVEQGLIIAGSDMRGTIFGIYDVSEQIGVSPWYWWADVATRHQNTLIVKNGTYKQDINQDSLWL